MAYNLAALRTTAMTTSNKTEDLRAIKALIGAHFDALHWSPGTPIDWPTFTAS